MKKHKRELNFYPYYDADGMVRHFEEMAEKGWMLESIAEKKLFIRYRRAEPKKVKFAITYFADATVYDAGFTQEQQEYIEYCRQAGWQRIDSQGQIQVFCNERENPVPLETDPVLTMEIIHDAMKHSYLLGNVTMLLLAVMQLFMRWQNFTNNVLDFLSSPLEQNMVFMMTLLFVTQCAEIIRYYLWYRKSMASAREVGIILPVRNGKLWNMLSTTAVMFAIGYAVILLAGISPLFVAGLLVYVVLLTILSLTVPSLVKRFGKDTETNKKYSTAIIVIAVTVIFFGFRKWTSGIDVKYYPSGEKPVYVIENYLEDLDFNVYKDELPLYVEDLTGEKDNRDAYSYQYTHNNLFIADYSKYLQDSLPDYDLPILRYDIIRPNGKYMYSMCFDSLMHEFDMFNDGFESENQYRYEQIDSSPWQGGTAYKLTGGYSSKSPRYIIAYEDRIIFLLTEIELTQRQQTIVATKLAKI